MFIKDQSQQDIEYYTKLLRAAGSLSNLFSESEEPYLYYRFVENLFCRSFKADNLSRSDTSADASKSNLGIGIKTFSYRRGNSFEKIAEFNKSLNLFTGLDTEEKIRKISELRNERIEATKRVFALNDMIYHCVARRVGGMLIYEMPMHKVNIDKITNISMDGNVINFNDDKNEYKFNQSKSTLYKRFTAEEVYTDFNVKILQDPFEELEKMFGEIGDLVFAPIREQEHIFLPLYSYDRSTGKKMLYEKSGLNQWNAGGRPRDLGEVYIPIPAWIHQAYPDFFPPRDVKFTLIRPDGTEMSAKLCQENSKALMSDPNRELGEWLLRNVLGLKEGELLTYEKLESLGIDSVVIYKTGDGKYDIDFTKIGSYEDFKNNTDGGEDEE